MVCSSHLSSGEQAYTSRQQTSKVVQVASRTKLEVCVDHDFMDTHLLVKLNVDQMWLRPIGPAGVRQVSVRAEERQRWPGTHCQYVSILSSRNCSTPLPGFAVERDQTAMAPISRSSDDLLSIRLVVCENSPRKVRQVCKQSWKGSVCAHHIATSDGFGA